MKRIYSIVMLVVLLAVVVTGQDARPANPSLMKASFSKLPIYFIENRGVYQDEVKYYIQGADKTLFFTNKGITFRLKGENKGWVVNSPDARLVTIDLLCSSTGSQKTFSHNRDRQKSADLKG